MLASWDELPKSPGHVLYDRLQAVLVEAGFDAFVEALCRPYHAAVMAAPSLLPGRHFRLHLVGSFEGIDSERGLEGRGADSLSLRDFLGLGLRDHVPDHSWLSRRRARLPARHGREPAPAARGRPGSPSPSPRRSNAGAMISRPGGRSTVSGHGCARRSARRPSRDGPRRSSAASRSSSTAAAGAGPICEAGRTSTSATSSLSRATTSAW
jgi:Transposase domain (DUF772)